MSADHARKVLSHVANVLGWDNLVLYDWRRTFATTAKDKLPDDEIYVPPQHQPINPEDEDDVVPDQHAAFGIQRATQRVKEPAWKDLGLASLMNKGPPGSQKPAGGSKLPR
ncbi:hypothetical protein Golomagni_07541 [Golovinomyces magnicellulatus]|nr:hypothetical protein Golomagni_07541 [Golovinomyces magnicellulatus]